MDPLNLILLIIVIFIGLRLRSVLGMRDEDEQPGSRKDAYRLNRDAFENKPTPNRALPARDEQARVDDAAQPPEQGQEPEPEPGPGQEQEPEISVAAPETSGRGLAFLREVEPDFDEAGFLDGAGRAYEMILTAFAADDLTPVRGFLGDEVAAGFDAAIAARRDADQQLVTRILRLDRPALDDARVEDNLISLDVRFRAELISFICAADATLDEDALPAPATAHDVWTFARPRDAEDPNWALVATHSA